jgi:hypothetical protein
LSVKARAAARRDCDILMSPQLDAGGSRLHHNLIGIHDPLWTPRRPNSH